MFQRKSTDPKSLKEPGVKRTQKFLNHLKEPFYGKRPTNINFLNGLKEPEPKISDTQPSKRLKNI